MFKYSLYLKYNINIWDNQGLFLEPEAKKVVLSNNNYLFSHVKFKSKISVCPVRSNSLAYFRV